MRSFWSLNAKKKFNFPLIYVWTKVTLQNGFVGVVVLVVNAPYQKKGSVFGHLKANLKKKDTTT